MSGKKPLSNFISIFLWSRAESKACEGECGLVGANVLAGDSQQATALEEIKEIEELSWN